MRPLFKCGFSLLAMSALMLGMVSATAAVTNDDIIIRDPFILTHEGKYYLYGTEGSAPFSGAMDHFEVYVGTDLEHWDGPYVVFQNDGTFWANQRYWAPSIIERDGKIYLYGVMGGDSREVAGIQTFVADDPMGPFVPATEMPFTSEDYECIDPEIYVEDGKTYMVYSNKHSGNDGFYAAEMNEDLTAFAAPDTEHLYLFNDNVEDVSWAVTSMTDGAAFYTTPSGRLLCFFSTRDDESAGVQSYNMGYAVSDNGRLDGNWVISDQKMLPDGESGGHNMFFTNLDGDVMTTYHSPNVKLPAFGGNPIFQYVLEQEDGTILFVDELPAAPATADADESNAPVKAANFGIYANDEIPIRDAYVLTYDGQYYLFGTTGNEAFSGSQSGFQVYTGTDLETWEGPYTAFANDGTSWANQRYWAPEVYEIDGSFYLFGGWSHPSVEQRLCVLKADNPLGPYSIVNADLGSGNDPTLYEKDGTYYLLYNDPDGMRTSHYKGGMYCVQLTDDLSRTVGSRKWIFDATEEGKTLPLVGDMPEGWETYTTPTGRLIVMWSAHAANGNWYASSLAYFDEGLEGSIGFSNEFFTPFNMGHNNFFYTLDGEQMMMSTHYPNNNNPHPAFLAVNYDADNDTLVVDAEAFMNTYGEEYMATFADYDPAAVE